MKVFVTGVAGQLGHDVVNELTKRGHQAVGSDIAPTLESCASYVPLDITDAAAVEQTIMQVQPDAIVHCAAWTAVDAAEDEENQAKVRAINVDGTKHIADAAKKADAKMVYISTDYVFDGQGETPWEPDCKDYAPLNVYGQSKLGGELAVAQTLEKYFIVRIARSSVPDPHPGQCPEAGSAQLCSRRMPHLQGGQVAPGPPGQPQNEGSSKADAVKELGVRK